MFNNIPRKLEDEEPYKKWKENGQLSYKLGKLYLDAKDFQKT